MKRKADEREFLGEAPIEAYTIDRQLMLMFCTKDFIRLYRRDGTIMFHNEAKVPMGWQNGAFGTRHLPDEGKLVFFTVDLEHMDLDQVMNRHVAFTSWDYRHGVVDSEVVPIVELFHQAHGEYLPNIPTTPMK